MKKLVQLNIEGDAHIDLVSKFLHAQNADIVCLQEVFKKNMEELHVLPYSTFLLTMHRHDKNGEVSDFGVALFSREPITQSQYLYYAKPNNALGVFDRTSAETIRASSQRGVLFCELESGLKIATVHHTWTANGLEDAYQVEDTHALIHVLADKSRYILCGDFNIPRGVNSCYQIITDSLNDCIPQTIASSMHIPLHRVRNNKEEATKVAGYMVDYIFRTPDAPQVANVQQFCGMSDHCAFVANIG